MKTEDLLPLLEPWRARWKRQAWTPIIEEGDGPPDNAKFAGTPWLPAGEPWPICGGCNEPLSFFLQLDLAQFPLPIKKFGAGLLQLFYCTRDCDDGWEPFGPSNLARIVDPAKPGGPGILPPDTLAFPPKMITGWEEFADYPATAEHEELGLSYTYDFTSKPTRIHFACPELNLDVANIVDDYLAEEISNAEMGDKLGGWPHWIQGVEYPECPECHQRMEYIFQLDSEDNLPFMLGDVGTGHITQCPQHQEIVAFGWACG